ncbi:RusA family crossover junction endodeoxyribonuclease [Granulicatella balaenopterae]|nr:RusA family crossover junction endodeoxyribonuclease [Granulicatella balaenopterae]
MPMKKLPITTHQQKQVTVINGKPVFYEPEKLKNARAKLMAHLSQHAPDEPIKNQPIILKVQWIFPHTKKSKNGQYKITKPDTDNLNKLLKDCMTDLHFWKDDALVASEHVEKFHGDIPGIYIKIEVMSDEL